MTTEPEDTTSNTEDDMDTTVSADDHSVGDAFARAANTPIFKKLLSVEDPPPDHPYGALREDDEPLRRAAADLTSLGDCVTPFPRWHPDGPPLETFHISHAFSWLAAADGPPEHYSLDDLAQMKPSVSPDALPGLDALRFYRPADASTPTEPPKPTRLQRLFPPGSFVSDAIWEAGTLLCRLGECLQRIRPETTAPAPTEPIFLIDHQTDFADHGAKPLTVKDD